ncbi:MAG: hypothetical protein CSA42_03265 [Gammaproteobacteria bacterium]|nr:MAG: hypothetical protein CSA42_03265 [Gammaproteobacteria bacterium]
MSHFYNNTQQPKDFAKKNQNHTRKFKYTMHDTVQQKIDKSKTLLNDSETLAINEKIKQISKTPIVNAFNDQPIQNVVELAELIMDDSQPWQIHNCKIVSKRCDKNDKLPFLYHYDQLPDYLKQSHPLQGSLLANFNTKMTAFEACKLLGLDKDSIATPWFIKFIGSIVIFHEPMQLAIRLHWSNTNKQFESIYCKEKSQALINAMEHWQFIGRIDTLYKKEKQRLSVYDEHVQDIAEAQYTIPQSEGYKPMPANFALVLRNSLQENMNKLAWLNSTIQQRI